MPEGLPDKTPPQGGSDAVTPNLSGVCLTAERVLSGSPQRRNARTKPFPEVNAPNASPLTGINAAAATAGGRPTSHRVGRRLETINSARNHGRIVLDRLYRRRDADAPRVGTGFAMMAFRNRRQTPPPIFFRPPLPRTDPTMPVPIVRKLAAFLRSEDGPTAVEYAALLALIIVVCIAAITTLGSNANSTFSYVGNQIGGSGS